MTDFKLEAKERKEGANKVRNEGFIPGVVYGKGFENVSVAVNKVDFMRLYKEAGSSNLVNLKIDNDKSVKTLIQEIQSDPLTSDILHVDFFKVNMKEKIHAEIPLEFIGDSIAVIEKEGSLITPKDSIEVECLPGDLVSELQIDISILDDFEKNIQVADLKLPEGIEVLDDSEEIIAYVQEPRSEEEMADLEKEVVEDVSAIEVENKGEETPAEGEEGATNAKAEDKKE